MWSWPSSKRKVHAALDEVLKDADVLAHCLYHPGLEVVDKENLKREPGRPKGANLFPIGALSLVKNVAVLRFFCALKELEKSSTDVFQSPPEKRFVPFGL